MLDASQWLLFLGASMVVTLSPGPDNVFVITQGMHLGRWSALFTAWGMVSGVWVHTLLAAFGVAALIAASPVAFRGIRVLGALYLLYLAWSTWKSQPTDFPSEGEKQSRRMRSMFQRGFLMNVLNPKVGLFFIAFLPGFVPPTSPYPAWSMVLLGMTFLTQALFFFSLIAWFSGWVGQKLQSNKAIAAVMHRLSALVFLAIAVHLFIDGVS